MSVQRADIFHCQKCGRMAYAPHGGTPPECCGNAMVLAVSDGLYGTEQNVGTVRPRTRPSDAETEDAIMAEVHQLSRWCRSVVGENGANYGELAVRLRPLRDLLFDRFEAEERTGDLAKEAADRPPMTQPINRVRDQHRDLVGCLENLLSDLGRGEAGFRGWEEVCERFDAFAEDYRQHCRAHADLVQSGSDDVAAPRTERTT